jgi:hypothetical protein
MGNEERDSRLPSPEEREAVRPDVEGHMQKPRASEELTAEEGDVAEEPDVEAHSIRPNVRP